MNFNELFKVRPTKPEMDEFMITLGNEIATEERFESEEEAYAKIEKTDWNLVACLAAKMAEVIVNQLKEKEDK